MDKINQILQHPLFRQYMAANAKKEQNRSFCRHNMSHVLDVARIAYILNTEEGHQVPKEFIYSAALLHDIGRHVQYDTGEKHALVSARLAPQILSDCGFEEEEICVIIDAISCHSDKSVINGRGLKALLAKADQLSRACYECPAEKLCDWSDDRKNKRLLW